MTVLLLEAHEAPESLLPQVCAFIPCPPRKRLQTRAPRLLELSELISVPRLNRRRCTGRPPPIPNHRRVARAFERMLRPSWPAVVDRADRGRTRGPGADAVALAAIRRTRGARLHA